MVCVQVHQRNRSCIFNRSLQVLTMLMGEYDFGDHFVGPSSFWLSKLLFVLFLVDMSVVLMNLVLGLAVNDVDSILQESKVRRMVHETLTVTYLETVRNIFIFQGQKEIKQSFSQLCVNFCRLPCFKDSLRRMRITNSNTCQFKEVVYLNLVDIVHNEGNEIVIDRRLMDDGARAKSYRCPDEVVQNVANILK